MSRASRAGFLGLLVVFITACERPEERSTVEFTPEEIRQILKLSPLPPVPANPTNAIADHPVAARLGQRLFFDLRLSANGKISCATCHDPQKGFADGKRIAEGIGATERHAPALWNVAYQRWFTWSGSADSLWAQAMQPMLHEAEMGASPGTLRTRIADNPLLKADYETLFGPLPDSNDQDRATTDRFLASLGKAIEAYQRRIVSNNAPFDRFVASLRKGEAPKKSSPINESAQRGLKLFVGRGQCVLCHSGSNFSDGEFHNLGLEGVVDQGRFAGILDVKADRFNGTGALSDDPAATTNVKLRYLTTKMNQLGEFKTPTLRHATLTPPYMHDGRFATLREVIDFYSDLPGDAILGHREETLRPGNFSEQEKADLEAFIHSLTGAPLPDHLTRPLE